MIFLIEGIITIGISIIAFFTLTDRPETARWLTQEEKDLAIARVKSERVGQTAVLDGIDTTKFFRGILSPTTLFVAFVFMLNNITVQGKSLVLLSPFTNILTVQVLHFLLLQSSARSTLRTRSSLSNYTQFHHT